MESELTENVIRIFFIATMKTDSGYIRGEKESIK